MLKFQFLLKIYWFSVFQKLANVLKSEQLHHFQYRKEVETLLFQVPWFSPIVLQTVVVLDCPCPRRPRRATHLVWPQRSRLRFRWAWLIASGWRRKTRSGWRRTSSLICKSGSRKDIFMWVFACSNSRFLLLIAKSK